MRVRPPISRPRWRALRAGSIRPRLIFAQVRGQDQGRAAAAAGTIVKSRCLTRGDRLYRMMLNILHRRGRDPARRAPKGQAERRNSQVKGPRLAAPLESCQPPKGQAAVRGESLRFSTEGTQTLCALLYFSQRGRMGHPGLVEARRRSWISRLT